MFTTFLQTRRYHLFAFSFPETPLFPVHNVTDLKKRALSLGTTRVFYSFLASWRTCVFMRLGGAGEGGVQAYPPSVTLLRIEKKSECEVNALAVFALLEIF